MNISFDLPELNIKEDEIKLLLSLKLFEEGIVSLGKAAEIAGYSEKAYSEILLRKGIAPFSYSDIDLKEETENA
jgi:predicted HTH domain antitoxin